ncbi:MAG: YncE family protein [Planctomycetes bacterium]|nr:YncE family protein [Planctomycetota bacterium]
MSAQTQAGNGPYSFAGEIAIGGEQSTFWDYLSLDTFNRRLYVSGNTKVFVIDVDAVKLVGAIETNWVHGFVAAPELGRGFASNGRGNHAAIVDLKTLKTIGTVPTGGNPDSIHYEPSRKQVWVMNGLGKSITIFGASSEKVLATIPLPVRPEYGEPDPELGNFYVNLPDRNALAVVGLDSHEIKDIWSVPCEVPYSMGIDLAHHRLFVGCHSREILVVDAKSGNVLSKAPIGPRVDAVVFDPVTKLVIATNSDATATILRQDTPDTLTVVQTLRTNLFARTMALDLKTHMIYVASADFDIPSPTWETVIPTNKMVPGTFKVRAFSMVSPPQEKPRKKR